MQSKGKNPKRKHDSQTNHDKMVTHIANRLQKNGFTVKADHIGWHGGSPTEINAFIPDVVATSADKGNFIIEVETCPSYSDADHTKSQLTAFLKKDGFTTYVVIPPICVRDGKEYDPVSQMRILLDQWKLNSVKIGTSNPHKADNIKWDPDKK